MFCNGTWRGSESGRRAPVDTGKVEYVPADTVIAAVGENIDGTLYEDMGVELDRKGRRLQMQT